MRSWIGAALAGAMMVAAPAGAATLATTAGGPNNGNYGYFFDLGVAGQSVTLTSIDTFSNKTAPANYRVFLRDGSYVGHTDSSVGWTQIGSYVAPSIAYKAQFSLDVVDTLLNADSTHGIYIDSTNSSFATVGYRTPTDLTEGSVIASNNDISIIKGRGANPNFGGVGGVRDFTGNVNYTVGAIAAAPEPASWAMMIGGFGIAGGALRRSRKLRATNVKASIA